MVTISILTYNRLSYLKDLLISLRKLSYSPLEIIVVDNHSEDNTQQTIEDEFPSIKYIRTSKNIGVGARNLGMREAKGDIIITLDDDIIGINDNDINNLLNLFSNHPNLGAINFKVIDDRDGCICNWVHHCESEYFHDKEFSTYEITEGAVAFQKKALELSGYYPEYFFLSHEGPDLAFRIIKNGFMVIYSNLIVVKHLWAKEGRKNWRKYYYDTRNQLWFATRNLPFFYSILYLSRGLLSMLIYSIRDGFFMYWLKAIIDGLAGLKSVIKDRNVLNKEKMKIIKEIDSNRPSLRYLIRKRLFQKGIKL